MTGINIERGVWVNRNHPSPARKAPAGQVGLLGWLRANLFSSPANGILTLLSAAALYLVVSSTLRWAFGEAFWTPAWVNRKLFTVGTYPPERLWQPAALLLGLTLLFGLSAGQWGSIMRGIASGLGALYLLLAVIPLGLNAQLFMVGGLALLGVSYLAALRLPLSNRWLAVAWLLSIPVALVVLKGGIEIRSLGWSYLWSDSAVQPNHYGGLLLTVLLTVVGIAFSFPIGVALALGRRSRLPILRAFCVAYIELIRGVPLISLLFLAMLVLPLFLPQGMPSPANVTRAMIGITLFSAAYLAENVRGGLQSVPKGQWEAADSLGLSGWQKLRLIVLPQALQAVIPAIVGQFIALFKDTSLVALVGLTDLLGIARGVIQQPEWLAVAGGITMEVYLFIALIYFVFSYGMSWASRQLERRMGASKRP